MINRELFRSTVYNKLLNQSLGYIAYEAFVLGLPFPADALSDEDLVGLEGIVGTAIANLGGARKILKNAMESVKAEPAKYRFVKSMNDMCHKFAMEAAAREAADVDPNGDYESALSEANFTEEELQRFESATNDLSIDEIGEVVGKKIVATIKSEQESHEKEKALDQHIAEMLEESDADTSTEEAAAAAKESFYEMTLGIDNPRHPVSLFSKLTEVGMEAMSCLYPEEAEKNISVRAIEDLVSFYSLSGYRKEMSAFEAVERLIDVDVAAMNQNEFQEAALESLQNPACAKAAFVNAATVYTLMESFKTLNLYSPEKRDIESFISSKTTPAGYGEQAIESFVTKAKAAFGELGSSIRTTNDVDGLRAKRAQYDEIADKLIGIGVANEAFLNCRNEVMQMIKEATDQIQVKITALEANAPEMGHDQKIAFEQDLAAVNRMYMLYGQRPNVNKAVFTIDTFDRDNLNVVDIAFTIGTEGVTNRNISLVGVSEDNQYEYVKQLISSSKFKENNKVSILHTLSGSNETI